MQPRGLALPSACRLQEPRQTPTAVVTRINGLLQQALKDPELSGKIEPHGMELVPTGPEEVDTWVKRDEDKWRTVIQKAGITLD